MRYGRCPACPWRLVDTIVRSVDAALNFSGGSPFLGFLQYQAMMMDDVNESVSSPFTNFTCNLRADGGIQSKFMFGVEKRF